MMPLVQKLLARQRASQLPVARRVVLQEAAVQIFAQLPPDDRVIDAGGAVDKVEGGMEPLVGQPQLGRVWTLVGDPARVI